MFTRVAHQVLIVLYMTILGTSVVNNYCRLILKLSLRSRQHVLPTLGHPHKIDSLSARSADFTALHPYYMVAIQSHACTTQ